MLNRRHVLLAGGLSGFACGLPLAMAQNQDAGRLVLVFLRGAYDGLSMLVPYGDPHYATIRPNIAIPKPDGTVNAALKLDENFGLHPACSALLPLWQQGLLTAIPCAGSPDTTRSHFDAQYHWETGKPGLSTPSAGWMNVLSDMLGLHASAVGVGEANPKILSGPHKVQLVGNGASAMRAGSLAEAKTREAVLQLYAGDEKLANAMLDGSNSRMQTADMLKPAPNNAITSAEQQAANNGAGAPQGLALDARNLGILMRKNQQLKLGFLSAGGWDTHINQGAVTGTLAGNLGNLTRALVQLREAFNGPRDVVVVASEFGRTCAENGTRGTDHGHGNVMWLMGNGVNGGRTHGRWTGLAKNQLNEGRDLPVHHDFRDVFSRVMVNALGVSNAQASQVFQGFRSDAELEGLFKS
jgi:uncharacterized protein (DUF1501 family)